MCDANLIHDLRGCLNLKMPRGSESTAMRKATRALLHAVQQRGGLDGDGHFAEAVGQLEQLSRRQRDADPRSKQHGGAQHKDLLLTMVEKLRQPAPDAEAASDAQPSRPAPLGGPLGEPLGEIVVSLISLVAHMAGTMEDMQSQLKDMQSQLKLLTAAPPALFPPTPPVAFPVGLPLQPGPPLQQGASLCGGLGQQPQVPLTQHHGCLGPFAHPGCGGPPAQLQPQHQLGPQQFVAFAATPALRRVWSVPN